MFRISLSFVFIFFCTNSRSQKFIYSTPVANYPFAHSRIIGRVKNNIIVYNNTWSKTFDMRKSEILVYDDKMKLLDKTSFKSITPKISSVDFINEENSFSAILQYSEDGFFVCKLVSFDAGGNILNTQILERSADLNDDCYEIIKSPKDKNFALLKLVQPDKSGTIALRYYFIKNDLLSHADKIILPFNTFSSGLGRAFLDDKNLILPVNDTTDSQGTLALFKVDLDDNFSINTIRNLNNGYLITPSISINENEKYYTVVSALRNSDGNAGDKIFLWQLNTDLTDISTDTILTGTDSTNTCLQNIPYFKLNSLALKNNTASIIVSSNDNTTAFSGYTGNYFSVPDYGNSSSLSGGFYEGRVLSVTSLKELNDNGLYAESNVAHGPTWSNNNSANTNGYLNPVPKNQSEIPTLAVLNVDSRNNLRWTQCFNEFMEKDFLSLVNESVFINTQNSLHIIYSKLTKKNKQSLGDITFYRDGSFVIKPIISMNLKYTYLLNQSFQADANSLIIPCTLNGKLAFARLTVE